MVPKRHKHFNKPANLCPFIYTRHEKVKNCSNMIFSALRIFLVVLLSESINGTVSNDWNPAVLLLWFGSYVQLDDRIDDRQFV